MRSTRNIMITGASSGLGAALAILYAGPGVQLFLHGRNAKRLTSVQAQAQTKGATVTPLIGDIRDGPQLASWIQTCHQQHPLDLVIANAGVSLGTGEGLESSAQNDAVFETNVKGVLNTIESILPAFLQRRQGQIAIISSLASFRGFAGSAAYCASKAAVRIYGEALRNQCMPYNVQINVVCPGFIKTPMTDVNPFPMPFIMSAERAAQIIRYGLERNQARIAFPFPMYALIRLMAALPQSWLDILLRYAPKKSG